MKRQITQFARENCELAGDVFDTFLVQWSSSLTLGKHIMGWISIEQRVIAVDLLNVNAGVKKEDVRHANKSFFFKD